MAFEADRFIEQREGQQQGFSGCGEMQGKPLLSIHFAPSSRFDGSLMEVEGVAVRWQVERIRFGWEPVGCFRG